MVIPRRITMVADDFFTCFRNMVRFVALASIHVPNWAVWDWSMNQQIELNPLKFLCQHYCVLDATVIPFLDFSGLVK